MIVAALASQAFAAEYQTTAGITQVFDRPATSSLPLGVQFFTLKTQDTATTLPVTSIVADETSATLAPVTVSSTKPAVAVVTPLANEQASSATVPSSAGVSGPMGGLPVKVDRSSTVAQELQLANFERQNKIGEAFLLACELLKQNPDAEFAYDAAIRTSLVLQMKQDVERFYRAAIAQSPLPGKYYVQLTHWYQRQGMTAATQKLIADYTKAAANSPEFNVTACRLYEVTEEDALALAAGGKAVPSFPVAMLSTRAAQALGDDAASIAELAKAPHIELSAWESRTLLLQALAGSKAPGNLTLALLQRALANETNYPKATQLCDAILDHAGRTHTMPALKRQVDDVISSGGLTDVQAFFAAQMFTRLREPADTSRVLHASGVGRTPLVAIQRAITAAADGSTSDAVAILSDLIEEQPTDTFLRMQLARVHGIIGASPQLLQDLGAVELSKLSGQDRTDYVSLMTSGTVQSHDPGKIADMWQELTPQLTFSELMLAGDVFLDTAGVEMRRAVAATAMDRVGHSPDQWRLYALLARISSVEGDHQAELLHYQEFAKHDSDNVPLMRYVAELALQSSAVPLEIEFSATSSPLQLHASSAGGTDLALELYQRLIRLQPRVSDNYAGLMRAYQVRGEVESAKRVAMELADRASSSPEACLSAGTILEESGLYADSLIFYRAAVKQDAENFNAWMHYAGGLRKIGKLAEAEAIYKRILEEGLHGVPFNQPALMAALLAMAHDTNTVPALITYLDTIRSRDLPGKPEYYLTAAKLLMQTGQQQRAEAYLTEFKGAFPDSKLQAEGQLLLGQLQYTRKDYDSARSTFISVMDKFTSTPAAITAAFNVGEILRQMGKTREAVDTWEQVARQHPDDDKALGALYEAGLAAYVEMRDVPRATALMRQFIDSGVQDLDKLRKAQDSLSRMNSAKPIPDYNAAS